MSRRKRDIAEKPPRSRWKKWLKRSLITLGVLALVAGAIIAWAANRYLVEHVEIQDVAAFEAAARSSTTPSTRPSSLTGSTDAKPDGTAQAVSVTTSSVSPTTLAEPETEEIGPASYSYGDTTISIEKVEVGEGTDKVTYYVADVRLADASLLRSAFAHNKFGRNIIQNTSTIAEASNAIFAVNGDYYGFRSSGIIIRNGVIFRDRPARSGLAVYCDGTMRVYDEKSTNAQELLDACVYNTFSFGPGLVVDGEIVPGIEKVKVDTNIGNGGIQGLHPRTGIGMISPNHFLFIAVDGRFRGYSRGLRLLDFAKLFQERGARVAYNLDGGGSTTMWFNGVVVNNPRGKGKERGTSDIVYIARPTTVP